MDSYETVAQYQDDLARMGDVNDRADPESIILGGVKVPIYGVNYVDLSRFEQKLTIGDYSRDSDMLLSAWITTTWIGGALVDDLLEGVTDQRYRIGTLHTRHPGQLALPALTSAIQPLGTHPVTRVLGDFQDRCYLSNGSALERLVITDATYGDAVTEAVAPLNGVPQSGAVAYQGKLYLPLGTDGIDTFDGAAVTNDPAIQAVSLCLWDTKLFALDLAGKIHTFDGTSWAAPVPGAAIPADRTPRNLVWFYDRDGQPTVFVVTDQDLWGWEPTTGVLHPARLRFPRHPDAGLGAVEWRDDGLYITLGVGIMRYSTGGVISPEGLDRDDGLPYEYRGRIVALGAEYNALYALVEGLPVASEPPDNLLLDGGPFENGIAIPPESPSKCSLWLFNEAGWSMEWETGDELLANATSVVISQAQGFYRVLWAAGGKLFWQALPRSFHGPKQKVKDLTARFAPAGYLETGRFDANMTGFRKLASHLEVNVYNPRDGKPMGGVVNVLYRTDEQTAFRPLGTVSSFGRNILPFNLGADGFPRGEAFGWIEFRYEFVRAADVGNTPIVDSTVMKFIKLPLQGRSWVFEVPLDQEYLGYLGPTELAAHLTHLTTSESFTEMIHAGDRYRVRVAQTQGSEATGYDQTKSVTLNVVEADIPGYAWRG